MKETPTTSNNKKRLFLANFYEILASLNVRGKKYRDPDIRRDQIEYETTCDGNSHQEQSMSFILCTWRALFLRDVSKEFHEW